MNNNDLFNFSATAQLVVDPFADHVATANQEACRLLRRDVQELTQLRASQLFAPCFPALISFTQELLERGRGWCDHLILSLGSEERRFEVSGRCAIAGDDQKLYLSLQEVEELERLRERSDVNQYYRSGVGHWNRVSKVFHEFERGNQLLLEAAGEGIYGVDANGITTFVNPAAQRILGYSADELAWRNMHSMVHHTHADGGHFCVEDCPIFAAFKDGTVHRVEDDIFWSKSGRPINVEYTSTPIRDNGVIVGAVVIFRDISQKKEDKKRLLEALSEVKQLQHRLELENAYLQEEINSEFNHHQIIGRSPAIQNLIQQIELVAPTDSTVLIDGESGTGKELVARAIHDMSHRSERSLIRVNCAAIPKDLFESEFFGHVKGAFTGASSDRPGRFELADGGTLFLDEVGEIPLDLQGKLLRVLQEQQLERVGDSKTRRVNVRIIAATNRDLVSLMQAGQFREDLYFRLNVFPIHSIPLRQRQEDIPLLTQHFLKKFSQRANKTGLKIPLSELQKLQTYSWPGNIRELENVLERQVILAQGGALRFDGLDEQFKNPHSPPPKLVHNSIEKVLTVSELKHTEASNIRKALQECGGKVSGNGGAAELLGIRPTTLASKMKKLGIDPRHFKASLAKVNRA